jgi:hypothetical protein
VVVNRYRSNGSLPNNEITLERIIWYRMAGVSVVGAHSFMWGGNSAPFMQAAGSATTNSCLEPELSVDIAFIRDRTTYISQ